MTILIYLRKRTCQRKIHQLGKSGSQRIARECGNLSRQEFVELGNQKTVNIIFKD